MIREGDEEIQPRVYSVTMIFESRDVNESTRIEYSQIKLLLRITLATSNYSSKPLGPAPVRHQYCVHAYLCLTRTGIAVDADSALFRRAHCKHSPQATQCALPNHLKDFRQCNGINF
jgi:hypothetical protein